MLLALAAVATAWAAYQSRQWTGEQSQTYSRGTTARIAENRAAALAGRQQQFAAWLASRPFSNPAAPETPFALPQYRLKAAAQADGLERSAAAASEQAKAANERADNYMLAVVLFATALFFAGISMKLQTESIRGAILGLGGVICVTALIWMVTFPIHLTT